MPSAEPNAPLTSTDKAFSGSSPIARITSAETTNAASRFSTGSSVR
jgi:hypothetical protein